MKNVAPDPVLTLASPAFAQNTAASAPTNQKQLAAILRDTRAAAEREALVLAMRGGV